MKMPNIKKLKNIGRKKLATILAVIVFVSVGYYFVAANYGFFSGGTNAPSVPEDTMTRGLVGYWSFDEGTGQTAYDASNNGNNVTLGSGSGNDASDPKWTYGGKNAGAVSFDGSNDYVNAGQGASLNITSAITIEAWISPTSITGEHRVIARKASSYYFRINTDDNKLETYLYGTSSPGYHKSTGTIPTGTWTHVAMTYNGSNVILYINGTSTSYGNTGSITSNTNATLIGAESATTQRFYGTIDEVRIYNRGLSEDEVRYHYNRGGPVGAWNFDEGSGTTAYDSTENNNDGTLYPNVAMQEYDSGDDASSIVYGANWYSQTFTTSAAAKRIDRVKLKLFRLGSPGTLTVGIRATSADLPTGADLTSGTINGDVLSTSSSGFWYVINLTDYNLTASTKYAVVIRATAGDASNYVGWRYDGSSPTYATGAYISSVNSGSSWTEDTAKDFMFETWSAFPQWTAGKYGSAIEFDGVDDYVDAGDNSSLDITSAITISAWVKTGNVAAAQVIASRDDSVNRNYNLEFGSSSNIELSLWGITGAGTISTTSTLYNDVWYHVVGTYDGLNMNIYLNGVIDAAPVAGTGSIDNDDVSFSIGAREDGLDRFFSGSIDNVRVYDYARSADEIRLDYNSGAAIKLGPSGKTCVEDPAGCSDYGLVGAWNMNEGTGTIIYDSSNNANNGTLINGPKWTSSIPNQSLLGGGSALSFDGVDDYVSIPDQDYYSPSNQNQIITIMYWMKISSENFDKADTGLVHIIGKGDSGGSPSRNEWQFLIYNKNHATRPQRVSFYAYNLTGGSGAGSYFQDVIPVDSWIHVTGVIDGTNTMIYKNGVLRDTDPLSGYSIVMENGSEPIKIGRYFSNTGFFHGSVDDVRIYNRVLSAEEIRYHYNKGGPAAEWNFDEGSGQKAYDSAGKADGTLGSTTGSDGNDPGWSVP